MPVLLKGSRGISVNKMTETDDKKKTKQKLEKLVAVVSLDALLEVTKELQQATKTGREHFACQDNGLFHIFKVIFSTSDKIYRGYYMPVRGYEFYLRVVNSISHE